MAERRKYRFRAWHHRDKVLYPVLMTGKGGVLILDSGTERTCKTGDVDLMQFSGVTDSNGREIYECDVVEFEHDGHIDRSHVSLQDGSFRLIALNNHDGETEILTSKLAGETKMRVIGNIYNLKSS